MREIFEQRPAKEPDRARVALPNRQAPHGESRLILWHGLQTDVERLQQSAEIVAAFAQYAVGEVFAPSDGSRVFML